MDAERLVWDAVRRASAEPRLNAASRLQDDLSLDSIDRLELALEIETVTGRSVPDEALGDESTVADLLRALNEAEAAPYRARGLFPQDVERDLAPEQARWLEPTTGASILSAAALFAANRCVMRALFRVRPLEAGRVPERQVVFVPNHFSFLDPFALSAVLPFKRLRRAFWAETAVFLYANPLFRWVSKRGQAIPIDRQRGLQSSLKMAAVVLRRGHDLVWFPQGVRSRPGLVEDFRPGIGVLLERIPVTVVPVAIHGSYAAWPAHRLLPRPHRITVAFGEPIEAGQLREGDGPLGWRATAATLEREVAALHRETRSAHLTRPSGP